MHKGQVFATMSYDAAGWRIGKRVDESYWSGFVARLRRIAFIALITISVLAASVIFFCQIFGFIVRLWHFAINFGAVGVSFGWWHNSSTWGVEIQEFRETFHRTYLQLPGYGRFDIPFDSVVYIYVPWWCILLFWALVAVPNWKWSRRRKLSRGFPIE